MRLLIDLDEKDIKYLEKIAKAENRTRKNLIETVITEYLNAVKKSELLDKEKR